MIHHPSTPLSSATAKTLPELARWRAERQPGLIGFTFLVDGEREELHLTYADLDRQARSIAGWLQTRYRSGDRVLLLFGPGLDYVVGFFGCLYAGMIPVPAYPPDLMRLERTMPRLSAIARDCQPVAILGSPESGAMASQLFVALRAVPFHTIRERSDWSALPWTAPVLHDSDVAFLQYTSGSTDNPRGVMVTHANLLYQMGLMHSRDGFDEEVVGVSWLPMYHDLGLIAGVLAPFYWGRRVILMSPLHFVQKPLSWLWAMSRYGGTSTGGPNFGYDLCANRFRPEEAEGLDLSSWRTALIGAEPVRPETLDRFARTFAPYGFDPSAWTPSYGLAEATLGVSFPKRGTPLLQPRFSVAGLERRRPIEALEASEPVRQLVGCGGGFEGTEIAIVDPERFTPMPNGEIGEIWVSGPSVASGYWNRPAESARTFGATIVGSLKESYLRTGDMGFFHEGQLFPTGRIKELMIFQGRNVYPQDVERSVIGTHVNIKENGGAAFAIECGGEPELVLVQEIVRPARLDLESIARSMRQAIRNDHRVGLRSLVLVQSGTLPKTSSGKIQRVAARERFLAESLNVVRRWDFADVPEVAEEGQIDLTGDAAAIKTWLRNRIAEYCHIPEDQIVDSESLAMYVVDSITIMRLAVELEARLKRTFSPTLLLDAPTLAVLADRLAGTESPAIPAFEKKAFDPVRFALSEDRSLVIASGVRIS